MERKVIARVKGGLGNQLFCYAAARRLALVNNAELVIDDMTGFVRDRQYRRKYLLDHFRIPGRKATPAEKLEPFERARRAVLKWLNRNRPFHNKRYLEQEGLNFDPRLLDYKVQDTVYLDGLWQSEWYFKDVEAVVRKDLEIIPPEDEINQRIAVQIQQLNAVAVHVRWFDPPCDASSYNVAQNYYQKALGFMDQKVGQPQYFVFSDDPRAARECLALPEDRATFVDHNHRAENDYADLWLMTQCSHFIIANSTFSWWGAWLREANDKIIISPKITILEGQITAWNFPGLIPSDWLQV